jgi:hypothetical protein
MGTNQDARGHVPDQQRQPQRARYQAADQAGDDDEDEIGCDTQTAGFPSRFIVS